MAFNKLRAAKAVPGILVSTLISGTGTTTVYTCPIGCTVEISQATVANISGSAAMVGLGLGKAGSAARKVVPDTYSLIAGDTLPLRDYLEGHLLNEGDFIEVVSGTANTIDVVISGTVWSQ